MVMFHSYVSLWPFIVDLPIKYGDVPVRYVSLAEGNCYCNSNVVPWRLS